MIGALRAQMFSGDSIAAPLRHPIFRRIWLASVLSNLGILIQGVGAAWAMTQMASSADKVALVQTALSLPIVLIAMPAGAIADMYDRRIVALVALCIALSGATALAALTALGLVTPNLLLGLCFAVGCGMALMGPAWQSSVAEQVPVEVLPAALALNGISYNIARSIGPAIGGIVVATAGSEAAFALNAMLYLPLITALFLWKRVVEPSRLPPEKLRRAMVSGVRYIANSPSIKIVLARTVLVGLLGGAILALLPLIARDRLHGGAGLYGVMLGAFGIGAVLGALNLTKLRRYLNAEAALSVCTIAMGAGFAAVAVSRTPVWTMAALVVAGSGWTLAWTLLNIGVQLSAPRWVSGRALASYQAASSGGIALGAWGWGHLTNLAGVETALFTAGALMLASPLIGLWLRMPRIGARGEETVVLDDPEVRLELTGRSGPVVVEIEYRVEQDNALAFHSLMHEVQMFRQRNGAYSWTIARDVADPELWTERFRCPTWFDYLRQRNRATTSETATEQQAEAFHIGPGPVRVRRMLERPFGSVRSRDHAIDTVPQAEPIAATTASPAIEAA